MRNVITEWKNWRDIVATERVVDLFAKPRHQSHVIKTWNRPSYGKRDQPRPMELSSFATINVIASHPRFGGGRRIHLDLTLTPQAVEKIYANTLHIDDDTMNVEFFVYDDGTALVTVKHGKIIGEVWLARIDASTIPDFSCSRCKGSGVVMERAADSGDATNTDCPACDGRG